MGKWLIIFGVIGFIIFIVLVVTLLIVATQSTKTPVDKKNDYHPLIKFYLKGTDAESGEAVETNYIFTYGENETVISQGILPVPRIIEGKEELEVKEVPDYGLIKKYCWNRDHYLVKVPYQITDIDRQNNASVGTCEMQKIGDVNIYTTGDFKSEISDIKLIINSSNWFYHPNVCIGYSTAIISIYPTSNIITCDSGNWLNWTEYNVSNNEYKYLDYGQFRCGEEGSNNYQIQTCEDVLNNQCRTGSIEIPNRFLDKADKCFSLGSNLNKEVKEYNFQVRTTEVKNNLDYITFYIMDFDRRLINNKLIWVSEYGNELIGKEDLNITINY